MSTTEEKIREIEEELKLTKHNKATNAHIGRLKAKIAKLKREQQDRIMSSGGAGGDGYDIKKSGDSSVALIGLPSVGKSTILSRLTNKMSRIGEYAFTTLEAIPGIMIHQGTSIQVIDLPGIISGASKGKGRGKQVLGVARSADLIMIVLDVFEAENQLKLIQDELYHFGIRLDQEKPDFNYKKSMRGGIAISTLKKLTKIDERTIKVIMQEYKILNADVMIRSDIDVEQLIDALEGNRVYIDSFVVINKVDLATEAMIEDVKSKLPKVDLFISAGSGLNMEKLKDGILEKLNLIRVYLKPHGGETDWEEPLIVRRGSSVEDVCRKLHSSFIKEFKFARIWGPSAKHDGMKVMLSHALEDEDVLTIVRSTR
jgi:uncharacterized protein